MRDSCENFTGTFTLLSPLPVECARRWNLHAERESVSGEWWLFAQDLKASHYSAYLVRTANSEWALTAEGIPVSTRPLHGIFMALVVEGKAKKA